MIYALDTNILSHMLRRNAVVCNRYIAESDKGHECVVPPVAYYEIKRGLMAVNATAKEREFDALCHDFEIGEMNRRTWLEAARIYAVNKQKWQMVEDADLFMAAFCLEHGYTLVTNNTKHFANIDGLRLADWTK